MKKIAKKIVGIVTTAALISALSAGCVIAKNDTNDAIKVTYDGSAIEFDVEPEIVNDRVMVPMRAIFETFGAKVKWDGATETITSKKKSKTITMTIGSTEMTKNDETYTFDTAAIIEDGRTLVPVRAISDMLGLNVNWNEDTKTVEITTDTSDEDDSWKENTGTINLDTMTVTGDGISVDGKVITITKGGDFTVTGESGDGQIVIDTEDKAKLRLSGMSLTNTTGSAIYVKNADKAYITLTENTENTLTDGDTYTSGDEDEKGTITSGDNLEIKGDGSLTVNGNYQNGIDASDSLDIEKGSITVNAKNDGINVNDTLSISGGNINVSAVSDGIQAGDIVDITGGNVNVTTTGEVASSSNDMFGMGRGNWQAQTTDKTQTAQTTETTQATDDATAKGIKADWLIDISDGTITVNSTDHAIQCDSDIEISGGDMTLTSESNKGIKAGGSLTINDGTIDITKATEGIESKAILTVNGGDIKVNASDDGFNAGGGNTMGMGGGMGGMTPSDMQKISSSDSAQTNQGMGDRMGGRMGGMRGNNNSTQSGDTNTMTPPNTRSGDMPQMPDGMTLPDMQQGDMPQMPEGMTPPDMQNGNGDTMQRGFGGGMGGGMGMSHDTGEVSTEHHIQINGGTIYINAQGDGLDSNGSIVIDGGSVTVDGTTSGGNSAIDHDGSMMVNGGTLIAVSAIGMVEAPGSYSKQNVLNYTLSESVKAGTEISVKNSKGETIVSHKSANSYQSFIFSSADLKTGESYTVYVDGEEKDTFTISDVISNVGTATNTQNFMSGGMRGMRGQQSQTTTTTEKQS